MTALDSLFLTLSLLFFVPLTIIIGNVLYRQLTAPGAPTVNHRTGVQKLKSRPTFSATKATNYGRAR